MIDSQLLVDRYSRDYRIALIEAMTLIHQSGLLTQQVESNSLRVVRGFQDKDSEQLAKEIMQVQQTNRNLLALHEWAGNLKKEFRDGEES